MRPRTVFITGASSGLGKALSLELAAQGAFVAVAARRLPLLEDVASDIRARGGRALAIALDVRDRGAVREALHRASGEMGSLDMVIANAGVGTSGDARSLGWADVEEVLAVNVAGALATLVEAIPLMLAQERGHLVTVSSLAGRRGLPRAGAYGASKAALSAFAETLRLDLSASGIRVTDVRPGFIDTPATRGAGHPMPMKWPVDRAARAIVRALGRQPRVITFPWPLALLTALGRGMPAFLYEPLMRTLE